MFLAGSAAMSTSLLQINKVIIVCVVMMMNNNNNQNNQVLK
jgi:hypothetical protein